MSNDSNEKLLVKVKVLKVIGQTWTNSEDKTHIIQLIQGLHCLSFRQHLLDALLCGKTALVNF